jgi:MFS superfamily sulfate permease-like transporter
MWHGLMLFGFVALAPGMIHRIPLAALAAMLVYTGFRLASPREFINVFKIGPEQLVIFTSTIIGVLATDLLIGIGIGIAVKAAIHLINGVPLTSIYKPYLEVTPQGENTVVISAKGSAVFTNWIPFKRQIEQLGLGERNNVIVDLSGTKLVDHSVMEKLHELEQDFEQADLHLEVVGLEGHRQLSDHPHSARKKGPSTMRRLSLIVSEELEDELEEQLSRLGVKQYVSTPCRASQDGAQPRSGFVHIEAVVTRNVYDAALAVISGALPASEFATLCIDEVQFERLASSNSMTTAPQQPQLTI